MDCIKIKQLELFAKHGVIPAENELGQKFLISVTLYTSLHAAGTSDDLHQSISYAEVASLIKEKTEDNTFQLIERLAEYLSEEILMAFPGIDKVIIEVEKPWAPLLLPLDTVSVQMERSWHQAYLSIGSNMGDTKANLDQALERLQANPKIVLERVADYIETEPVGGVEQDNFLNSAVGLKTLLSPEELLGVLHEVEAAGHRERLVHWGPRTIDLDLILYDDCILQTEDLVIPHLEMRNRGFVLEPLCEIAPYAKDPVTGKTIQELRNIWRTSTMNISEKI